MTADFGFDDLGDEERVKFSEAEIAATLAQLDDALSRLSALRTEVKDPDGFARFTLGDDGQLLTLFISDAAPRSLTNLALEMKLNSLLEAGNEAMRLSRKKFWESVHGFGDGRARHPPAGA